MKKHNQQIGKSIVIATA